MSGPLISVSELRDLLPDVTVLDVRYRMGGPHGPEEYDAGHVPGAVYVDLGHELAAPPGEGGRHPLPPTDLFEEAMRRAGVSDARPVVVYDDWSGHAAGRAWWLLRFHGHADVRVLDGAWPAWRDFGGEVQTEEATAEPGDFTARPGQMPVVDADRLLDVPVILDARAPERYRGDVEPIDPVAGHVPGARNMPTSANLAPDGRFRTPGALHGIYAAAGATGDEEVVVYCGSGVTATHDVLALELAGVRAALYPGSWSDWIRDPARPVVTGGATSAHPSAPGPA